MIWLHIRVNPAGSATAVRTVAEGTHAKIIKGGKYVSKLMITSEEVAEIMEVSKRTGQDVIRQLNEELKSKGFIVKAGRAPRKYFFERTGLEPEEVPHATVL